MRMLKLALLAAALAAPALAAELDVALKLKKKDDSARVEPGRDSVRIVVKSGGGIGGMTLTPRSGAWPRSVSVRLTYATGKGFENLEGFGLTTPTVTASGGLRSSGKLPFAFVSGAMKHDAAEDPRTTGGLLNVKMERTPQGIEITLPPHLLTDRQPLDLSWIDAYR